MSSIYVCLDIPAPALPGDCVAYQVQDYEPSPFALDLEAAGQIGTATALVWAAAWVVRTLARFLRTS